MKRLATFVAAAMLLTVVGVAPVAAATLPVQPTGNHCPGHSDYEDMKTKPNPLTVLPAGTKFCVKAGSPQSNTGPAGHTGWLIADGATTIKSYMRQAGITNSEGIVRDISYAIILEREVQGPDPAARIKVFGPAGDPWYRWVFRNTGDNAVTCKLNFKDRGSVKSWRIPVGQGYRTGWQNVRPGEKVISTCWSLGERVAWKRTIGAPNGWYGPLSQINIGPF